MEGREREREEPPGLPAGGWPVLPMLLHLQVSRACIKALAVVDREDAANSATSATASFHAG